MDRLSFSKGAFVFAVFISLSACSPHPSPSPPIPSTNHVLISEVLAGVSGDNNREFIELYNPRPKAVDLNGWKLVYRLPSSSKDLPVFTWNQSTLIPAQGHYLLVHEGEAVGAPPDALFSQALNTSNGALALITSDGTVADGLGWGQGAGGLTEGHPAQALENGQSLERKPGGEQGNGTDTENNQADFGINRVPSPQDTGSAVVPAQAEPSPLELSAKAPANVQPGDNVPFTLALTNTGPAPISNISVTAQLPTGLSPADLGPGTSLNAGRLVWDLGDLPAGQSATAVVSITAPWSQGTFAARNLMASAPALSTPAFASPTWVTVVDGPIPIGVARGLLDQPVTVEGTATITTGALFAGSGNTKFYMADTTGGVQIWVPGGGFGLDVPLGSKVRVHGTPQAYRGTVELVADSPDAVEVLSQEGPPEPVEASISQTQQTPDELAGKLIRVEGQLTQAVEETYSYNLTLVNAQGETLNVYVDKQTQMQVDGLAIDQPYAMTGIFETPDGVPTLYPRIETDFERSYPKAVIVTLAVPASMPPGRPFEIKATVSNHTDGNVHGLAVTANTPASTRISHIDNGGKLEEGQLTWDLGDLAPGQEQTLAYQALTSISSGALDIPAFKAQAGGISAHSDPGRLFVGTTVPIWAIQGDGPRSPYVLQTLTTRGVVTGVFPGLSGFWIQSTAPDGDSATSDGVFVNTGVLRINVARGDLVDVTGQVRETSEQTQLQPASVSDVDVVGRDVALPAPVELDPPASDAAALVYDEAREGMLVAVHEPAVAVGPTSIYGEYTLVLAKYGIDRIMHGQPAGRRIVVDDGANTVHDTRQGLPYVIAVGDTVQNLVGPLAYTFGQHKIEPLAMPRITPAPQAAEPKLADTPSGEFRLMTWNAENLFDALPPNPSDPPPPTPAEYRRNLAKVAATIRAAGAPTVVALQEVENIDILKDLAALDALAPYHYSPYLMEGTDSRGIDVGYLVRSDQADVGQERQLPVPDGLLSRPPLLLSVQPKDAAELDSITLLNNHFTALSGGIEITRPRRVAQAELNAQEAKSLLAANPDADVAVLGDLNSFYGSPPLQALSDAGLTDLFDGLAPDQRYSYIYQGVAQTLDHILVSPALASCLRDFTVLHLDSPYPPPAEDDATAIRKSDHDPLVASFRCEP